MWALITPLISPTVPSYDAHLSESANTKEKSSSSPADTSMKSEKMRPTRCHTRGDVLTAIDSHTLFFFFFFLPSTPSRTTSNVDAVLSQQCIHSEPELFVTKGELLFGTSSIQCIICWWSAISLLRHVGHVGFLVGGHEIGSYARKILSSSCLWSILTEFTLTCIWCSGEGKWCRVPLSQLVGGLWCRVLLF